MSMRKNFGKAILGIAVSAGLMAGPGAAQSDLDGLIRLTQEPDVTHEGIPAFTASSLQSLPPVPDPGRSQLHEPAHFQTELPVSLVAQDDDDKKSLAPLPASALNNKIQVASTSVASIGTGVLPDDAQLPGAAAQGLPDGMSRGATFQCYHWAPSAICHYPLYFEDAMLERHGQTLFPCLQPIVSGAKFLATIPMLPYKTTLQRPCEPQYVLGSYRPGTCAPVLRSFLPYDGRAAAVETLSLASFFWAAPL